MPESFLDYKTASKMRDELAIYASDRTNLSPNAELIFNTVYLRDKEDGKRESIVDRMAAISVDVASADMKYMPSDMPYEEKIGRVRKSAERNLELYVTNKFRANTPTNLNMGRWETEYDEDGNATGYKQGTQMGSACFVLPVGDTFGHDVANLDDGILEAWVTQQLVHKGGGGTGFSFQRLRPKGSIIGYNPAVDGIHSISWDGRRGVSSGYESFLNDFFNQATEAVKQGNSRRGANMGIQRIDHMDFLDHMYAKSSGEWRMKNFNLSLAVTDEFMEAAERGQTYTLFNPHRANPRIKKVLEQKFGVENPELVKKGDIATRQQFEAILEKNRKNLFAPLTTPNMYMDDDGTTVMNAYTGEPIGIVVDDIVRIEAKKVKEIIAKLSHSNGEPGMVFLDRMNEYNAILDDKEIEATNPCGEQPLPPYGACNLASINLGEHTKYQVYDSMESVSLEKSILEDEFTKVEERKDGKIGIAYVDWKDLRETIGDGVRFLDNVIDRSDFPAAKIKKAVEEGRNIGLGYMGVYDSMVLLKIRYGSEDSYKFAERVAKELHDGSLKASQQLAEERGAFPLWEKSSHNPNSELFKWYEAVSKTIPDGIRGERKLSDKVDRSRVMTYGGGKIRNSARMTQAPTGTIRRSAGHKDESLGLENLAISSGIEPMFSLVEQSNILNANIEDFSSAAVNLLEREGLPVKEIMGAIRKNGGSAFIYGHTPQEAAKILEKIPSDVRDVLVTATGGEGANYEISPEQHVRMLATFQKYNDSAISKTLNVPAQATPEEMGKAWTNLWKSGAKGGTIYRDSSREFQILNTIKVEKQEGNGKIIRPLAQNSITIELPYLSSTRIEKGDSVFEPDRCFTTLTFNPVNGRITGVFQNIPEIDQERISTITRANLELSRTLKNGRSLDEVISDIEKMNMTGSKTGVIFDKAVSPERKESVKYQVNGGTTTEALLNSLYMMRFLTEGGKNLDPSFIGERISAYYDGEVSLRTVINSKGKVTIEEDNNGKPSILKNKKVVRMPEEPEGECLDCG